MSMIQQGAETNDVGEKKENEWIEVLEQIRADGICQVEEEAVYGCMTSSPMGTSRKTKDEGVYVGQWVEVVESMEFSSGCFSVPSKVESKIIK